MKIAGRIDSVAQQEQRLMKCKSWQMRSFNQSPLTAHRLNNAPLSKKKTSYKDFLLRRGTKKDYLHLGTFQEAIGPVLLVAQLFAMMPVRGVTSKSVQDLSFSWLHFRTIYSLLALICFGICSGFVIAYATQGTFSFGTVESIIFFCSIFFIASAFFHLARRWPKLMQQWSNVEHFLHTPRTEKDRGRVARRIKMIGLIALTCSMIEHLLSMLTIIYYTNICPVRPNHPIESFLYSNAQKFFYFFNYSNIFGVFGKYINILSTFVWNFNDIFVISVSVALSDRFRELNDQMQRAVKRPNTPEFWMQNRAKYRSLCKLCEAVDDAICLITFLGFSNNLYFICSKILKSVRKKPSLTHTLYFWFSFLYLMGRTLTLSLSASEINEESRRPLIIFRSIPRGHWCAELKRFSHEVATDVVALSGLKSFQLTRGLVLSVAGTIFTYELVLLQFNKEEQSSDCT